MKYTLVIFLFTFFILVLIYGCANSSESIVDIPSPSLSPVNKEQAFTRAKQLLDKMSKPEAKYRMLSTRKEFPPFSACYVFEIQLDAEPNPDITEVVDSSVPGGKRKIVKPGTPMAAFIWIEADTGRILRYDPNPDYTHNKNKNRLLIKESDLLSQDQTLKIAQEIIGIINIDMNCMKLIYKGNIKFPDQYNYRGHVYTWSKFVDVPDVGNIMMPETIIIQIDAETGEMDSFLYKNYNAKTDIHKPQISRDRAIELAQKLWHPKNIIETATTLMIYPGQWPKYDKQELAWQVQFKVDGEDNYSYGVILDANTGKIYTDHGQ